jgi:hypothetical protein
MNNKKHNATEFVASGGKGVDDYKPDKSKLEGMMGGNTIDNKKHNAAEFVAPGGRGVEDYSLEAPGLANNLRVAAEANERTAQSIPVMVNQVMEDNWDKFHLLLVERLQLMEAIQRRYSAKQKLPVIKSICPASMGVGLMLGFLATVGIAWFWVIPAQVAQQVAQQRGSDWAIGEYLATPEGTAVRNYYRNKKTKGSKK